MNRLYLTLVIALVLMGGVAGKLQAQEADSLKNFSWMERGYLRGYGIVNYYQYDWETDPNRRNAFDAERLNLYLGYHFNDWIEFKSEIEFEHGGTGATMEFDVFEEFGEFEQEIEAGGEIILEQINLQFKLKDWLNIRLGKFRFYMGLASKLDDPTEYFTTHRSEVENTILPLGWYEHGIEVSGQFASKWSYKLYLVNGLDASGFSSANWVRRGYQKRFETVNANNMAVAGRLDYQFAPNSEIGVCGYFGNSAGNRPKPDTEIDAYVGLVDVHLLWEAKPWRARAYAMYGHLSNSEAISDLNRNLSNNLNVKRTPVAEAALGAFAEVAYDLLSLKKDRRRPDQECYLFGRYDYYDSMYQTSGDIFDNPRWQRSVITGGVNYFPHPQVVLKAQYSTRALGSDETENTFSTGIGFKF
ncbi:MAG: outer membrane beta-barrel protein [Phaeodactylibacter sp.]|nr:outer membrane beta-barrel protein [Phaeodactylibacter sp.]